MSFKIVFNVYDPSLATDVGRTGGLVFQCY